MEHEEFALLIADDSAIAGNLGRLFVRARVVCLPHGRSYNPSSHIGRGIVDDRLEIDAVAERFRLWCMFSPHTQGKLAPRIVLEMCERVNGVERLAG